MPGSKGAITVHSLYNLSELQLSPAEPKVDRIIHAFLQMGEGVAARWIEMPKGVLFLQVHPDDPASGAVYVYDRTHRQFYLLEFEGCDEHLTVEDFSRLLPEYNLLQFAQEPASLHVPCQTHGTA